MPTILVPSRLLNLEFYTSCSFYNCSFFSLQGPGELNEVKSVNGSSDLCFQCRHLNSVEIICHESDKRIPHLIKVLKRNGISNLNLSGDYLSMESDCLKMLYGVLVWVNDQIINRIQTQRRRSFRLL